MRSVTVVLTFALRAFKAPDGIDETSPEDYTADAGDKGDRWSCRRPRRGRPTRQSVRTG